MRYNKTERIIAALLAKFPFFKSLAKRLYQRFNFVIHKKDYYVKIKNKLEEIGGGFESESFFGYYDKSPLNSSNKYIIYHETDLISTSQKPDSSQNIFVILQNHQTKEVLKKIKTSAYNWQQGSKLMWVDEDNFVFNDYLKGKYISRIFNIKTKKETIINFPIYDVHCDFAYTLSFEKLMEVRPDYGYRNHISSLELISGDEGVFKINLKTNEIVNIVPLSLLEDLRNKNDNNELDWINHIMISPNGQKIMFLHRWEIAKEKFDSLYVVDSNGKNLKCISNNGMVSHCFWKNNLVIIGYLRNKQGIDNYYEINVETGECVFISDKIKKFGDGHPSICGDKMIFDTYPNKSRMKELFVYEFKTDNLRKLGEFYESFNFLGENRCDLHPRFSYDGKLVFIDSVHTGRRKLYEIEL